MTTQRDPVEEFHPAGVAELDLYQKREKIYTRKIEGFYQKIRVYTGWPLLLLYFIVPWLTWNGQPAVLFDLPARQFHIFFWTFWPQDFYLLAGILIIAAFALFTVTAWAGRIWCGYTCPQTVWTAIFMWAEQKFEGSRNQRIKLDNKPMHWEKFWRKLAKHTVWVTVSLATGVTFVGYFTPIYDLVFHLDYGLWGSLWITFFTCATYINAGYMREQVCIYMCPYARFQSVMFDKDTLLVSYDAKRGEPRGSRKKDADLEKENLGACVDCNICVQVCPTGIDIRDGLQVECINCALCIDGCNSVMDQMGYERGLIRYTTEHELEGYPGNRYHPRFIAYAAALLIMLTAFGYSLLTRVPLEADVVRERGKLYQRTPEGRIENMYVLKIMNKDQRPHTFKIAFSGLEQAQLKGDNQKTLSAGEIVELPLRINIAPEQLQRLNSTIYYHITSQDDPDIHMSVESRFIGPGTP
ncbi:cytochrome c oxidase accessory protein CcoG [Dasania sp. GY-MA-18]|uniref:Cytochrome c oxidase accessory protein CcoG n=1 Tax=Dasania phycosphaerae TaxID=2950436 RepID=A0A9J6RMZ1_9GAMM|nr:MULTISPECIES: cytochrome c oxidase accessory protein CcoG [Dasania]MCR8923660.1 cytochrome c oxidase accessory protein CcoG [Dasania sp. GY-MA-18]MCZ0866094.1 cytochrome c oxidase accessory protein CcoG [Dasania phycosphaerae]MCZ0869818.1 cytochrome c oxidase accessory protein CcoG [Dasania phycosphaerae]